MEELVINSKFEAANLEYKYLILARDKAAIWEHGENRKLDLSGFYEKSSDKYELLIEDPGFNERKLEFPKIHEFLAKTIENSYISKVNS